MKRFLVASLLFAAAPLAAQTFPTDDPVIKRIYTIGMDSSHLKTEAHVLFDSLGPRLMGTPNIKRAQDWLVSTYKSWGVDAKEEQYGTWRGWERGHSHIDLVSPRKRTLQGQMVGYSPGTGGRDVTLETIILPRFTDSTEFVKWLPKAKGKLVMISAPLPTCRPQDDWAANATPESKTRMDSLMVTTQREWASVRVGPNNPSVSGASAGVRGTGYSAALGGGELGVRLEQGGAGGIITSRPKLAVEHGRRPHAATGRGRAGRTLTRPAVAAASASRGALNTGWGAMEVFETYNVTTPAIALDCEDYGLVVATHRSRATSRSSAQPRRQAPRRAAGVQRRREHQGHRASGRVRDAVGALRFVGRFVRRDRQRHRHAHDARGDAHPAHRVSAIRSARFSSATGAARKKARSGSKAFTEDHPEVTQGTAGAVQPGQRHRPSPQRRRRRTRALAGAHQRLVRQDPDGVQRAAQRRKPGAAGTAGRRRQRRLLVRLLRTSRVRTRRDAMGLRHGHVAHRARHVRQGRVRRSASTTRR